MLEDDNITNNDDAALSSSSTCGKDDPPAMPLISSSTSSTIDDYELGPTLGTGSFGRVRIATHKATSQHFAIKMLKKTEVLRFKQVQHMLNERDVLHQLSNEPHPFVVNLSETFQDAYYLYFVLQYAPAGELFTHLRQAVKFDSATAQFYAAHIVLIFEFLHAKGIVYRDLKPENILLDESGYLKLTDFGFAKKIDYATFTLCGTPEYLAPEVLLNKGHGKGVDWWTLGILTYEMLRGEPPFVDEDPMGIYEKILAGKLTFPRGFDKAAKSLVKKLLTADLTRRYGCLKGAAQDIKGSKWLSSFDFSALLKRELKAPIVPTVSGAGDTSNFEEYSESEGEAIEPHYDDGVDPFEAF